ncbi:MKI67 FHA domain-interacting nucleolar phosphoprotein [Helicoverpa armigera]|uniref:MKI67 FHA domain-interacting nucleolar phosphoprotein n=1 Tax=Helicoverpa armigera TaxID=29058 RepID=UPI003083AEF5
MEENVALDSEKQKKFVKSIRGIKKLIKKNEGKAERGKAFIYHIPHGFYEHQMTEYFKQFGVVTNARVIRSKRTGNSKGYAFVEFKEPAVGQIVAETMNNYLMGKRLIKAEYIPPEKQRRAFRKHWNSVNNPTSQLRLTSKKEFNTDKDDAGELKRASKILSNLNKTKEKLSKVGINYDFFAPVDVPQALIDDMVKPENQNNDGNQEIQPKQARFGFPDRNKKEVKKNDEIKKKPEPKPKKKKDVDYKTQKEKEERLKRAGVLPPKFIRVSCDSCEDSDGSMEYDKLLDKSHGGSSYASEEEDESGNDDAASDEATSPSDSDDDDDDEDDDDEVPPKKRPRGRPPGKKVAQRGRPKKKDTRKHVEVKRKMPRNMSPKKAKYEKHGQKPMKKAYRKKH